MLVAVVTFQLPKRVSREEIAAAFQGSASRYLGMAGLLRKNYWVSEDGMRAGGIYFWESRAHADAAQGPRRHCCRADTARSQINRLRGRIGDRAGYRDRLCG